MAFIDEAKFLVKGGDGGRGCVSFRREKFVPRGGPDGGDGGHGGCVILEASSRLRSLIDFRFRSHFKASNGSHGRGKKMHGRKGDETIVIVPRGSVIKDAETDEVLVDLVEEGARFIAANGGRGGMGNVHFSTSQNRAPRKATPGQEGEERWLKIELKLLADIGLVGQPNAGKSTLLSKLSAARPKIADYPFTTLEPQLGMFQYGFNEPWIIADVPGLIKDAHLGAGLGDKFLRHIERTSVLLHIIDASTPDDEPWQSFLTIDQELHSYDDTVADRPRIVVLNKIDQVTDADRIRQLIKQFEAHGRQTLAISAITGEGLEALKEKVAAIL